MGDHDHGLAFGKSGERFLHFGFIIGIGKSGSLVKDQDWCIFKHCSGNRQTLCLTTGDISTLTADDSIHAVRHFGDDVLTLGIFQSFHHFFPGGIFFTHADVIIDRHFQQFTVLEHERYHIHQLCGRNILYVHAADADLPFRSIVKAGDQAGQGGLTAAGGSYESDMLSFFDIQIDLMQGIALGIFITEGYVLQRHGIFRNLLLRRCLRQRFSV